MESEGGVPFRILPHAFTISETFITTLSTTKMLLQADEAEAFYYFSVSRREVIDNLSFALLSSLYKKQFDRNRTASKEFTFTDNAT